MTSEQTRHLPRRRGLNELMESVAAKLAERPDHVAAAKVLEEMQDEANKLSGKSSSQDNMDIQNGHTECLAITDIQNILSECPTKMDDHDVTISYFYNNDDKKEQGIPLKKENSDKDIDSSLKPVSSSCSHNMDAQNGLTECPPSEGIQSTCGESQVSPLPAVTGRERKKTRASRTSTQKNAKISLLPVEAPVHGSNAVKLFRWLLAFGKDETIDLTLPVIEEALGVDARTCRRIIAAWTEKGVCEKEVHRRGMRLRLLMDEQQALGSLPVHKSIPASSTPPTDKMEKAIPELCPRLIEAGFSIKHLRRIRELLALQKIEEDALLDGLRYAEFELEHDQMRDGKGNVVSSPVDWVYRCLSKDGTYRTPKNYVSPAELHRREREKRIQREREELEAERQLREAELALAFEREKETIFSQIRENPEGELAQKIMGQIPSFLRERGGIENPLVQKACLVQINRLLKEASEGKMDTSGGTV